MKPLPIVVALALAGCAAAPMGPAEIAANHQAAAAQLCDVYGAEAGCTEHVTAGLQRMFPVSPAPQQLYDEIAALRTCRNQGWPGNSQALMACAQRVQAAEQQRSAERAAAWANFGRGLAAFGAGMGAAYSNAWANMPAQSFSTPIRCTSRQSMSGAIVTQCF